MTVGTSLVLWVSGWTVGETLTGLAVAGWVGLMVGACVGCLVVAACSAAGRADAQTEKQLGGTG